MNTQFSSKVWRGSDTYCEPCAVNEEQTLATHMVQGEPYCDTCMMIEEVGPCGRCDELVPNEDCETNDEGESLCWDCRGQDIFIPQE